MVSAPSGFYFCGGFTKSDSGSVDSTGVNSIILIACNGTDWSE